MHKKKSVVNYTTESLYSTISSILEGVISVNKDSKIVFINQAAQKLTGWDGQDAIGQPLDTVFNIINVKTHERADRPLTTMIYAGEKASFSDNAILITKSGIEIYIAINASHIINEDQQVSGIVITFRDVTSYRQIEDELKIERNNLKIQFQYAPVGMIIVDEHMVIQSANDYYIDMFGNMNVIGTKLGKSLACVDAINNECGDSEECGRCLIKECVLQVVKSRIPYRDAEKSYKLIQNGRTVIRNLKFNLVPIKISGIINVLVSVDDITEYRMLEENLKKSRDFYLTLFDDFPALIWKSKTNKNIDYVNKKWLEFTGRTFEQELGEGWAECVHPDDMDMCVKTYTEAFDKLETFEMEYRLKRFDGEYRWILDRAGPYYDIEGNFAGYIGACYDITEQRQAREILKRYELLSEKASDIILLIDVTGNIIEANAAAIRTYGYMREELLSKKIYDIDMDNQLTKGQLDKVSDSGTFFESVHYRKDGTSLSVEVSTQSAMHGDSKVIISIIRDITERKQIELETQRAMEATKAAYRAKSEFLANMSHEIRTPLNGLNGMLYLTMLSNLTPEQMDNLSTAKVCADSLLKIINDVLDLSKMEAGKMTVEPAEFDFKVIIEKIVKAHHYRAKEKGLELIYQLPVDLPSYLIGDFNRLQQVLNNLLGNAVKFTDRGSISLIVKMINHMNDFVKIQFSIEDSGIGISRYEMDKLFISFSQVDGSQTRRFGGTGLGLVISRQLIEMMGGTLKVESNKGKGSIFSFILGFEVGERDKTIVYRTEKENIIRTQTNAKVLLVEDDKINQTVISRMLKEIGYSYDVAACGRDALSLLEQNDYQLCLMDIQMSGMDGVQTTAIIRKNEKKTGKYMPVIAITAYALQGDRERFLSMGLDEYIAKPFQMSELFDIMEKMLAGHVSNEDSVVVEYNYDKSVVNEINNNIDSLKLIIKTENMQEVERIAHDVKVLASSIYADKVKALAFRIELAARRSNLNEVIELFSELNDMFQKYINDRNKMEEQV